MTGRRRHLTACAASVFAACAAHAGHHDAATAAPGPYCPVASVPARRPPGGRWVQTVDPGKHAVEVRAAANALNSAGSALKVEVVAPGAKADVRVLSDRDLAHGWIAETRGCLKPGLVSDGATVTLDDHPNAGSDLALAMTRQLAVAFGLGPDDKDRCSTMAVNQQATRNGCGAGLELLQPVDRRALIAVWGAVPDEEKTTERGATP